MSYLSSSTSILDVCKAQSLLTHLALIPSRGCASELDEAVPCRVCCSAGNGRGEHHPQSTGLELTQYPREWVWVELWDVPISEESPEGISNWVSSFWFDVLLQR